MGNKEKQKQQGESGATEECRASHTGAFQLLLLWPLADVCLFFVAQWMFVKEMHMHTNLKM